MQMSEAAGNSTILDFHLDWSFRPACVPNNSPFLVSSFSIFFYFSPTHEQPLTYPSILQEPRSDPICSKHIFHTVLGAVPSKLYTLTHGSHTITLWGRFYCHLHVQMRGWQRARESPTEPQVGRTLVWTHKSECVWGSWIQQGKEVVKE